MNTETKPWFLSRGVLGSVFVILSMALSLIGVDFDQARQAVRSDPRWVNDYLPRVKGLVVRQQDQIMLASDFFESRVPALSEDT